MKETNFIYLDSIPRSRARREGKHFYGGAPRSPLCLDCSFPKVDFNSSRRSPKELASGFHCNHCRVWWHDTDLASCYICGDCFCIPQTMKVRQFDSTSGYHVNRINLEIDSPFCPGCAVLLREAGVYPFQSGHKLRTRLRSYTDYKNRFREDVNQLLSQ